MSDPTPNPHGDDAMTRRIAQKVLADPDRYPLLMLERAENKLHREVEPYAEPERKARKDHHSYRGWHGRWYNDACPPPF